MLDLAEKYLIESIKKGDRKSFEFLFRSYYSGLCKYARNIIHNETVAEDLVMDVFVRLWEAPEKLTVSASLSGYLYRCIHHHCINFILRKHKQFEELNSETVDRLNAVIPPDSSFDPFLGLSLTELTSRIELGIEQLPVECRKIFVLSRKDELSHKEIAAQLGISENTVKVQIYRALLKMHLLLRDFLPN